MRKLFERFGISVVVLLLPFCLTAQPPLPIGDGGGEKNGPLFIELKVGEDATLSPFSTAPNLAGGSGVIVAPVAYINPPSPVGFDGGYTFLASEIGDHFYHLAHFSFRLFERWEGAQIITVGPDLVKGFLLGTDQKVVVYRKKGVSVAALGRLQMQRRLESVGNESYQWFFNLGAYGVISVDAVFLGGSSRISFSLGWMALRDQKVKDPFQLNSNLDWSVGMETQIFPKALRERLIWLMDYSNYSYVSGGAFQGISSDFRGAFNTGVRVVVLREEQRLSVDVVGLDLLDQGNRGISVSINCGLDFIGKAS